MDEDLPPWNKHGSHSSSVPYNTGGECQKVGYSNYISVYDKVMTEVNYGEKPEDFSHSTWIQTQPKSHELIGHSSDEDMSSLSSCMSGAFKALLPDYHETSSTMTTNIVKYSSSSDNHCLNKPDTIMDENKAMERLDRSLFVKDPLGESSASVTHMFPPRCAQYVQQEKNRELDQGNCNWTSVIKDALETSNGMTMEQNLSMDACAPLLDFNPVHKRYETINDHFQIPEVKLNVKKNEHRVKGEPGSYISVLSDGISTKKDVLEMGNEPPSILDVGSSIRKEESRIVGIKEHEPGLLPGINSSLYTPLYSSEDFIKSRQFPLVKQSFEDTFQGIRKGHELSCNDVFPTKITDTDISFKHVKENTEMVPESSNVHGLHHFDQAEVTDGKQDYSSQYDVQDNAELILKVETKPALEIQNSSTGSETRVPDQPDLSKTIHADFKSKDSQVEPGKTGKLNKRCCQESSSKNVTVTLTSAPERVLEEQSPGRTDCSPQLNLQKAKQNHKKGRKRKKTELEKLFGPIQKTNKKDDPPLYESEISDNVVKPDTTGFKDTNQKFSLADCDSMALKEEGDDKNIPSPKRKALSHMSQLELVGETSPKNKYICSEAFQEETQSSASITKTVCKRKVKKRKAKNSTTFSNQQFATESTVLSIEKDCMSHSPVIDTTLVKEANDPTMIQLESSVAEKKKKTKTLLNKDNSHDESLPPTTLAIKSYKGNKKRQAGYKNKKGYNAPSLLNSQSSLDSVYQTDSESSNTASLQNSTNKSKQSKMADINTPTKTPDVRPQKDVSSLLSQSKINVTTSNRKTLEEKRPVKMPVIKNASESTVLDKEPSAATQKQETVSTAEVESPVVLSSPRKSLKKKPSNVKEDAVIITAVDQTVQSVLNPLSESDISTAQPTIRGFKTRKNFEKNVSHERVSENHEPANSSVDSIPTTETEFSGVRQQNTRKVSSKRRTKNIKSKEAQVSTTRQQEDITVLASEGLNPDETVKFATLSRNKTVKKASLLTAETQDVSPSKKISDVKIKAVHTPLSDQTMQPEIHPSDSATEIDMSDVLSQKKTKSQIKKATKRRNPKAVRHSRKQSFPDSLQQENSMITTHPCVKIAESHDQNQVSISTEASPQNSLKKAKKMRGKQLLKQKEENEQSSAPEPAHREDEMSNVPSVVRDTVSENFEMIEVDQMDIIKEETTTEIIKIPKKRGRKPKRKKMKMAGLLTEIVKEEEHNDISYNNTIVCEFQDKIQTCDESQKTAVVPEEPAPESTQTQRINSGPDIENLSIQGKSKVTEWHTKLGEMRSSSRQNIDREDKFEQKPRKRGRPPKKRKLSIAHLKDNTCPPVKMSDNFSQDTENTFKASASPEKQNVVQPFKKSVKVDKNVIDTGTDISGCPQSATDPFSQSIPGPKRKKGKNFTKEIRNLRLSSLRASSRTYETTAKDLEKVDIPLLSQNSTQVFSEDGKTQFPMPEEKVEEKLFEKTAIEDDVLAQVKTENAAPIKVVRGKKRGRKRRKIKVESYDLISDINTDNIVVSDGVSSNVVEESDKNMKPKKIKPNTELKNTQETDLSVEMSDEKQFDNSSNDGFTRDGEGCVIMRNKLTNKRKIHFKPKENMNKPLTCKYCGISFRHITAYTVHQRIHTGDKPYQCKICGKSFAQLSKLKSHRDVHKHNASFPCPCCSRTFLQKGNLLRHFKVHLQESKANGKQQKDIRSKSNILPNVSSETPNKYRCLICKQNFGNNVKLQNHMQSHETEKPLSCKDCGKVFGKLSSLAAHEKTHWPVKPYACSVCGKGFNQLKALKKHSQDHAGETPFSCFHCGHAFSALSALRKHQASKTCIARKKDETSDNVEGFIVSQGVDGQVNTPVFFKCQLCKQLFRKWCHYTLHLQTHTSSPPYICFSCGQCYKKDSDMNVHCEVCCQSSGEEMNCGAALSEIMQGVTKTYTLKCTSPQRLTSSGIQQNSQMQTRSERLPISAQTKNTDISKHPKSSTQSPNKLPPAQSPARSDISRASTVSSLECMEITPSLWKFKCSHCGQRFKQYRTLSAHQQTHAPGFRYTCAHCGLFFERWSKLWLHRRYHRLKSCYYRCKKCNLQFRFVSSFKEHMNGHAGRTPDAYPSSPKTFIQEASLHAHQCESYNLQKSLKCDVCSKTFSNLRNLVKHSLLHNGSTSHVCPICNISLTNARVLKEHLKKHSTTHGLALPNIPSKPLDFSHKCKRCKASFSTGDLLFAHQICHSRDSKTSNNTYHREEAPTSKVSGSSTQPSTRRNQVSDLKLDNIPNDVSLYVYSHPDKLYVPPSRVQLPLINLDTDEHEDVSQNISPQLPNCEITPQTESTRLPQATLGQETTGPNLSESVKQMEHGKHHYSPKNSKRSTFVETSVEMEVETLPQQGESFVECFECADCTEKLTSVLSLYEHYILHAMGETYVQVH